MGQSKAMRFLKAQVNTIRSLTAALEEKAHPMSGVTFDLHKGFRGIATSEVSSPSQHHRTKPCDHFQQVHSPMVPVSADLPDSFPDALHALGARPTVQIELSSSLP
jgi:hypothetical protein